MRLASVRRLVSLKHVVLFPSRTCRLGLACLRFYLGFFCPSEAEAHLREVVSRREQKLGPSHPDTLTVPGCNDGAVEV